MDGFIMWKMLEHWLRLDKTTDPRKRSSAIVLYVALGLTCFVTGPVGVLQYFGGQYNDFYTLIIIFALAIGMFFIVRSGHDTVVKWLLPLLLFGGVTQQALIGTRLLDGALFALPGLIVMGGLLLGRRGVVTFSALSLIIVVAIGIPQIANPTLQPQAKPDIIRLSTISLMMIVTGGMAYLSINSLLASMVSLQADERQLMESNRALEETRTQLAARTHALEVSVEISRHLSTILDQRQLVLTVVDELGKAFNYYHVHVYLFDESREHLVMVGGSGEVGQILLAQGHKIPKGRGLVGRAAETNWVVLVPDTLADPQWLPNKLLPDTRSEIAVPISIAERVLGVLDVQQNTVNGLTQQDAELLQVIAGQLAVAVQNAGLFSQIQRQAERGAVLDAASHKIQVATTLDAVLQATVVSLSQALGAQRATIQISGATTENQSPVVRS
jgi:putative methionine-R-sulfoxide reductase with GAF domain